MSFGTMDDRSEAVQTFARFCEHRLGPIESWGAEGSLSDVEARVLRALGRRAGATASEIAAGLGLDGGYLSRILRRLETRGLVERAKSQVDGRRRPLDLTPAGREAVAPIEDNGRKRAAALLSRLSDADQHRVVAAMRNIQQLLGEDAEPLAPYQLRPHRPGDMGWLVHRHGALYAQEYGFDETFEAFVAEIAASFVKSFDPKRERCWIAEKDGEIVGSVLLMKLGPDIAKLRLLYVEPKARGLGIGRRFVDEAIRFAHAAGYSRVSVWTNDALRAARRIYADAGFRLVREGAQRSFGQDLVEEIWELPISGGSDHRTERTP
jgi:DNA-binding MarR family transcriptional regulator/predicted GNAT family acetyltransferase